MDKTSPTFNTLVRKPYFPVIILDRVGVHVGFDHKFVNRTPEFIIFSKLGMLGFIVPKSKPGVASKPISSAIINKIFGSFEVVVGVSVGVFETIVSSLPQAIHRNEIRIKVIIFGVYMNIDF